MNHGRELQAWGRVDDQFWDLARAWVWYQVWVQVWARVGAQVDDQVWDRIWTQVKRRNR